MIDTSSLDRNTKALNDSGDRLESENSESSGRLADYSDAISACKEAQRMLLNMRVEGSSLV